MSRSFYYEPFGGRINLDGAPATGGTGDATHGFTGQEHDDDLGLINMKGRVYDPTLRRFLTPDPVVADTISTQDWNPYSYVRNSPFNYTDPTGYIYCDASCEWYNAQAGADLQEFFDAGEAYQEGGIAGLAGHERDHFIHDGDAARHQEADRKMAEEEAKKEAAKSDGAGMEGHDGVPEAIDCPVGTNFCEDEDGTPEAADYTESCGDWMSAGSDTYLGVQLCSYHNENDSFVVVNWQSWGEEGNDDMTDYVGDVTIMGMFIERGPARGSGSYGHVGDLLDYSYDMWARPLESNCSGGAVGGGMSGG